jgi:hypothetical protein
MGFTGKNTPSARSQKETPHRQRIFQRFSLLFSSIRKELLIFLEHENVPPPFLLEKEEGSTVSSVFQMLFGDFHVVEIGEFAFFYDFDDGEDLSRRLPPSWK